MRQALVTKIVGGAWGIAGAGGMAPQVMFRSVTKSGEGGGDRQPVQKWTEIGNLCRLCEKDAFLLGWLTKFGQGSFHYSWWYRLPTFQWGNIFEWW